MSESELVARLGSRALIFDLDGTLVDSLPGLTRALNAVRANRGMADASAQQVRDWVGEGAELLVRRGLSDSRRPDPALAPETVARALEDFLAYYGDTLEEGTRLYPGVREVLETLQGRGLALALVTNKPRGFLDPLLAGLGLGDIFGVVLGGDSLEHRKPHPQPLLHAARVLEVPPARCLMVGDSATDVAAARAAAMPVVQVTYGYARVDATAARSADFKVDSLDALL